MSRSPIPSADILAHERFKTYLSSRAALLAETLDPAKAGSVIETKPEQDPAVPPPHRIKFELAEKFYHELSLPLNLLMAHLCLLFEGLLDGPQGQDRNISAQLECLMQVEHLMHEFYPRMLQGSAVVGTLQLFDTGLTLRALVERLAEEMHERRVTARMREPEGLGKARVVGDTAEAFMEIMLLRALAVSEPGSSLDFEWAQTESAITLTLKLWSPTVNALKSALAQQIPMVPFSRTRLELAGIAFEARDSAGPWILTMAAA